MSRGAVFLDRDGTIIEDTGYLHEPAQVRLLDHAAEGLAEMAKAGWPLVIVSNQSGIARGLYGPEAFASTTQRLRELLAPHGVQILDVRFCPHHPDFGGACDCRKPATKLFRDAAAAHDLDLGASWYIGDKARDVEPAQTLGGRGVLLGRDAPDLLAAARLIGAPRK